MRFIFSGLVFFIFTSTSVAQFSSLNNADYLSRLTSNAEANDWSFETTAFYYIMPNDENKTTLIGTADHNKLHLEARYNYEDEKTVSLFGGYNFETGKDLVFGLTPIIGFSIGNTDAVIPGLELSLNWKILDYYSESEYVFDLEDKENNFFYTWAELGITPFDNLRMGGVASRTLMYDSDLEIERGVFFEYSFGQIKTMIYYFYPFSKDGYLIPTFGIEF